MGLNALEIFKLLPRTNCKECGFPTCLAFAMQLAMGKVELSKCPHVSEEAKIKLEASAAPPIATVEIGKEDNKLSLGGETVLFRHEKTFYNPPPIGVRIAEDMEEKEIEERLKKIRELEYERVGIMLRGEVVAVEDKGKGRFLELVKKALDTGKALLLMSENVDNLKKAVELAGGNRPLVYGVEENNLEEMGKLALEKKVPVVVKGKSVEEVRGRVEKLKSKGVKDIVLEIEPTDIREAFFNLVALRRAAILKRDTSLGYPVIFFPGKLTPDPLKEALYAGLAIAKYGSMVILNNLSGETLFPLLVEKFNIFTDPQRPLATPEGIYEIGKPTEESPVLVTVNFSLTYFIVSGEVENSRIPSWLLIQDSEGLSVLTAWAADKFNAETIAELVKKSNIEKKVKHRKLIIPGYVAQIVGELEEELPDWEIVLGPREASHIPAFLKMWKSA